MDEVGGITGGIDLVGGSGSSSPSQALSQEEFFEIMIAELTNQDPLEPLDNQQFLNQITQLQTLDAMSNLTDGINSLVLGQTLNSAGSLIGRDVVGEQANGTIVAGTVERVTMQGSTALLVIGDQTLQLSQVLEVFGEGGVADLAVDPDAAEESETENT